MNMALIHSDKVRFTWEIHYNGINYTILEAHKRIFAVSPEGLDSIIGRDILWVLRELINKGASFTNVTLLDK